MHIQGCHGHACKACQSIAILGEIEDLEKNRKCIENSEKKLICVN